MRAAIYCRVSLDRSGQSLSPERQEAECRRLAERRGWDVAEVLVDRNLSAYKQGVRRPEYERLVKLVETGAVGAVLIYSSSRLARSVTEFSRFLDLCGRNGVALASVADQIDTSTAYGRAMTMMNSVFAQLEADVTRERVESGHAFAAQRGRMHSGGSRQFGYTYQAEVVPEEATVVRELAESALAGESLRRLATDLNERGVKTSTGREWSSRTVGQLLRSPRLVARRVHRGVVTPGTWEPVLDDETFDRLQVLLARRPGRPKAVPRHLLTGLLTCGRCGGALKTMGFRMHNGQPFERYQCVKQPGAVNCGGVAVAKNSLDAFVTGELLRFLRAGELRAGEAPANDVPELERLVEEDQRALVELAAARFVHRSLSAEEYGPTRDALQERLAATQAALEQAQREAELAAGGLEPGDQAGWWETASLEDRRAALRAALERVEVHPAKRRGGNRFDSSRVRLVWRLGFLRRVGLRRWETMTDEEREAARLAYEAEREAAAAGDG